MTTKLFTIPTTNVPQSFTISLAGVEYQLTVKWNDASDAGWVLDIADSNGVSIVANVPLITGCDCLNGLAYLGINGSLFVSTDQNPDAVPTLDNFGTDSHLYFQTDFSSGS